MKDYIETAKAIVLEYSPKLLYALLILVLGMFVIKLVTKLVTKAMRVRKLEPTLQSFVSNLLSWALKILLLIVVISQLGVETTSFAAIIGAATFALGLALQEALANFAGGVLIILFKPFKVGDLIEYQSQIGTVKEIQIFTTQIITPDYKLVIIPNGTLANGNIVNISAEGKLRVDLTIGVGYDEDIKQTQAVIMNVLNAHPLVLKTPAPSVRVVELADSSVNFAVHPWCRSEDYWDTYFGVTENCKLALDTAGIEIPYPHSVEIQKRM